MISLKINHIRKKLLRTAIIAEFDAVNLYEEEAALTTNKQIKRILFDVAKAEKEHVSEFQTFLLGFDMEQSEALEEGKKRSRRTQFIIFVSFVYICLRLS